MAKLTDLTAAANVAPDDLLLTTQSGTSKKATRELLQTYNAGTLTTDKKVLDLSATWNAAGVTFTGIKLNATDTASASGSLLMDLHVGGSSKFRVTKLGTIISSAGFNETAISVNGTISAAGGNAGIFGSTGLVFGLGFFSGSTQSIGWSNTQFPTVSNPGTIDVQLFRDAADTLAQRRSTNAQTFRIYQSFTDASNFTRGALSAASAVVKLAAESAGTGEANIDIELQPKGSGTVKALSPLTAPNLANGRTIQRFTPLDNQPPASNFATLDTRNSVAVLDFDAATDESAIFVGYISQAATLTSGIKVIISWSATSATSGDCVWAAQFEKTTGQDIDSDGFDTATTATTTTSGTSGVVNTTTITCTTIDSLAAGDCFRLKIYRDADAGGDTMTGDAELLAVELQQVA